MEGNQVPVSFNGNKRERFIAETNSQQMAKNKFRHYGLRKSYTKEQKQYEKDRTEKLAIASGLHENPDYAYHLPKQINKRKITR